MNLGSILLAQIVLIGAVSAWGWIRRTEPMSLSLAIRLVSAVLAAVLWRYRPDAWPVIVVPFAVTIFVPMLAILLAARLPGRWARARLALVSVWYVLHPVSARRAVWIRIRVHHLRAAGHPAEADALLATQENAAREERLETQFEERRWAELAAEVEARPPARRQPAETLYLLRAITELGPRDRFIAELLRVPPNLRARSADVATMVDVTTAAYLGRRDLVVRLFAGRLRAVPPHVAAYWAAVAAATAGDPTALHALADSEDDVTRAAVAYRMTHPFPLAGPIDARAQAILDRIDAQLADESAHGHAAHPGRRAITTHAIGWSLLAIHIAVALAPDGYWFARGVFWGPSIRAGEWWRLVTAGMLHIDTVHLTFNLLGLAVLAPLVERAFGPARFLAIWWLGSVGAFAFLLTDLSSHPRYDMAAGASAGLTALLGATLALSLIGSLRDHSPISWRRLQTMVGYVVAQVVFDLLTPQVSMAGHLAGVVIGLLVGLALAPRPRAKRGPE